MLPEPVLKLFFLFTIFTYSKKKLKMTYKFYLLAMVIVMHCTLPINAQNYTSLTDEDFASYPYWIEMMDDQSVNFLHSKFTGKTGRSPKVADGNLLKGGNI